MSTDALSALASEALGNEGTQQQQQQIPPQQQEAEESLEKEEAAGGPPMPAAGVEGAAIKQSIPMQAEQAQDTPATKPADAMMSGAGGVGDAAMAAVDDRLDTGDLPHTNGYTQELEGSSENPHGNGAGVGVDYGRVANLTGNEGEQVPPMSFDIDQPAAEAPKAAGEPEQGEAMPPAPGAESTAPLSLSPKPSSLPPFPSDNASISQAHSIQPPAESQQTIPQPLDSHSQASEQATVSQLHPGQTQAQQQTTPQPEQQQQHQAPASSLPPLPSQPSFSPSMDSLPQDPAPLPSQLVNHSVASTDLSQAGPEAAIPAAQQVQQSADQESAYEPSGQPTTSSSSSFQAFPTHDSQPQQQAQPQQNGHASDASTSFPPTHPDLVAPPEISPSLAKRPFEPDNSAQSLPYQGDVIEPTFKRQKVSPETEDQHAFQSAMSAAGFPKAEETQSSLNQFDQPAGQQQQHGMPVDALLNPSSSQPQQQQPYQQQQQGFGQQNQQSYQNAFDQGDSSMLDQSMIDQSLDMQQDQKDGESSRVESPANIDGQQPGALAAPQPQQPTGMPKEQIKYAQAILRQIKKKSEAAPFLQPVDPVALGIPHYTQIITHPMDLGTVDRKLVQNQYEKADDFAADVRLIWDNCVTFNGPDNPITAMAKNLSVVFEKQNAKMPTLEQIAIQKRSESPAAEKKSSKKARRSSTAGGGRTSGSGRAAAYEADYDDYGPSTGGSSRSAQLAAQKKKGKNPALSGSTGYGGNMSGGMMGSSGGYGGNSQIQQMQQQQSYMLQQMQHMQGMQNGGGSMDFNGTQLKFCKEVIKELFKKQHQSFAYPFYEPVDYMALGIPDYPKVIRRPIDLGTMKRKLDAGHYPNAASFENDFKLLINNCFTYNPPMTPVHKMGEQLQQAFYEKWRELPHPQSNHWGGGYNGGYEDDYNESGFDSEQIHLMQRQLELLTGNLEMMKAKARMNRPPSYGGPGPMSMQMGMQPMQMSPVSMQMQMPSPPAPAPVQKAPRPPPAPRQPKPPSAPKRKSDASLGASTSAPPAPPKPRTTKRSSMARGDTDWEPQSRGGDSDYEEPDAPADPMVSVTFDMKRELAEKIQEFDGPKLDKVVEIIRNSAPELLADENKEIELDIDMLDQRTLLKLYEFAVHPVGKGRQLKPKKNKPKGRNRGVDEVAEEERINLLQAQLDAMEGGGQLPPGTLGASMGANAGLAAPPMDGDQAAGGAQQGGRGDVASSSSEEEDEDASESESERSNFAPED